jgi:hypothetical protein
MSWDEGQTLTARWQHACEALGELHPHWTLGDSYTGFTGALTRTATDLAAALVKRLRLQMKGVLGEYWMCGRWIAFAADGTRIEAPHTAGNERGLGCAGRDKTAPQVSLTTLWHMRAGLPWSFRVGPGTTSERVHLGRMVADLPPRSLVVADAGFAGYGLCRRLILRGHSFLLRVGGNITLLKDLGYSHEEREGLVYLWPIKHQRWRPLVLRLIRLRMGSQEVYLLTNVLDPGQLGEEEASSIYELRRGEEVYHRSYKQTMQRRKLLSRTPETCLAEATWTVLGLWLLSLLAVSRIVASGGDPLDLSVAKARDAVRRSLRRFRPCGRMAGGLELELASARKDDCRRLSFKGARNYPRKKRQTPPGPPKIREARSSEIKRSKRFPPPEISYQWTA